MRIDCSAAAVVLFSVGRTCVCTGVKIIWGSEESLMRLYRMFAFYLAAVLFAALLAAPAFAQSSWQGYASEDDAVMAYAQGMNDLSVKVVAVIFNYGNMVWEAYD